MKIERMSHVPETSLVTPDIANGMIDVINAQSELIEKLQEETQSIAVLLATIFQDEDEPNEVARWRIAHENARKRRERDRDKRR